MLVNVADDELRQGLHRDRCQTLKALEEEGRDGLVEGNALFGIRSAAKTRVICEDESNLLGEVLHDAVHVHVRNTQLSAAVALKEAVNEHEGAEIGAHPAVLPEALEDGDGGGGHHARHGDEIFHPRVIIVEGVLHAAPLAPFGNAGLVVIAAALAADAVLCLPQGVKALELFVDDAYEFIGKLHFYFPP